MPGRTRVNPAVHEDALAAIADAAAVVQRLETDLAAARAARDDQILKVLRLDVPPTHAQIAEAAGLKRGGISAYAARAWSGTPMPEA